jgi:hypothetical protein
MIDQKFPKIPEKLIKLLEQLYPPLEYSEDTSKERWAFRGGQREVISKLKAILTQQKRR